MFIRKSFSFSNPIRVWFIVSLSRTVTDLSSKQEDEIRKVIVDLKLLIEGELRSENLKNVKRLQDIGSYRGVRHRKSLPVRGQRTKTNSRTRRSKKRQTISLGKKAV